MKRRFVSLTLSLFSFAYCVAQTDSIRHRIFLLGDGGALQNGTHPVIDWLKKNVDWDDTRNMAIFLGDNIYPYGLPGQGEPGYEEAKKVIDYQISLVTGKKAKSFFVPGNHDWLNGKIGGWYRVMNEVDYINGRLQKNIEAWPRNGCPGPTTVEIDSQLVVVLADSQWFLYVHDKPGPGSNCLCKSVDEFTTELNEIIVTHPNQLVLLAMHHPIYSQGVHGGAYTWKQHIFPLAEAVKGLYIPLPVLGSIYPIARGVFGSVQDFNHPAYREMAKSIEDVLKKYPNTMIATGHDHSLELLRKPKDSLFYIVSGAAAELTRVKKVNNNLLFSDVNFGFSVLEITTSGKVYTKFYNLQSTDYNNPTFQQQLITIKKQPPLVEIDTLKPTYGVVNISANDRLREKFIRDRITGENYRKEWVQKITVPALNLRTEEGGLKPVRVQGSRLRRSLRLQDANGHEWTLRSIEDFPEAVVPLDLRQSLRKDLVEQGISASYPYASLSFDAFAEPAGVPVIRRKLVYIPNDSKLGRFRSDFSNKMAILEEQNPAGVKRSYSTDDLVLELAKDNDNHVDQIAVLKARLLDMFIMDFNRHEDQWLWAKGDTGKGKLYYPISRNHDQAFFMNEGFVPFFARQPWFLPEVQGFRPKARNIRTFNRPARNFDRFFLTGLSAQEWEQEVDIFLAAMTDKVIENALHQQPQEIQGYRMNNIINTLKERRKFFKDEMMEYYRFISKEVDVVGSNNREQFKVTKLPDGKLQVVVNKISKKDVVTSKTFDRVFDPKVTHEVRLYGLGDDDRFIIDSGFSPIRIRMIGGPGVDTFVNNGKGGRLYVYDAKFENNVFKGNFGLGKRISRDPEVNRFDRQGYKYDLIKPSLTFGYNRDQDVVLGAAVEFTRNGFRKEPYWQRHLIAGGRSFKTSSWGFRYEGDFTRIVGHEDLTIRADLRGPNYITNFFGYGNNTHYNKSSPNGLDFYRINYNLFNVSVLMRRQLQSWMRVNYGINFQTYKIKEPTDPFHLINVPAIPGVDQTNLFQTKAYLGPHFKLDINSQNNKVIPTRGLVLDMNVKPMFGLNKYTPNMTKADVDMRIFFSLYAFPNFVLATRFGYGHIFGKQYDIPEAYYLSGLNNLRGYRQDRFGGKTVISEQNELRFKIGDFSTYLFPGSIGLHAFLDVGQVKLNTEKPNGWWAGYGGGIWIAPVKRFVITGSLAWSAEEDAMPIITFGFPF